jgi:hypothetical protein
LAVGIDVLDQGGVLEQVDALMMLTLRAEQPLGAAVDVEGTDPERILEPLGHLRGAQLGGGDQDLGRQPQAAGVLFVGQPHGHRRVGVKKGWLELVERLDQLWQRQGDRQGQDPMQTDRQGGRPLTGDVGGGGAAEHRHPLARQAGPQPRPAGAAHELGADRPPADRVVDEQARAARGSAGQ